MTPTEVKKELENKLIIGTKIKIGKECAEETGLNEADILELVEGHFEYDNGLYTEGQTAPSVWDDKSKDWDSIYHLFGNDLNMFLDSKILGEKIPVSDGDE
jgi:hypothetical protein